MSAAANLFTPLPDARQAEVFTDLLARPGCRIERIVSFGQTTPADRPYRQPHEEWVVVLSGAACILMDGIETALAPGDHLLIAADKEHRVTFTDPTQPTVWLAIHLGEAAIPESLPPA
ncbi:cupin domain-containing protein [Pseudomonas sp. 3A(2025)]